MDNTDTQNMHTATSSTTPAPVSAPTGISECSRPTRDDVLDQPHADPIAYMQSIPPLQHVDIPTTPSPAEARAYTHPQPSSCDLTTLPSIPQIPQTTSQEPSAMLSGLSMLPLTDSPRSGDSTEDKTSPGIPTALAVSPGNYNAPSPQIREMELPLESIGSRQEPSTADDHTGEAPYVMKLPRSGVTTWRTTTPSSLVAEDVYSIKSLPEDTLCPADPDSQANDFTALDTGALIHGQHPTQVLATDCGKPEVILSQSPTGDDACSTVGHSGSTDREALDVPTSVQVVLTDGLAAPDVTALGDLCTSGKGEECETLCHLVDAPHTEDTESDLHDPSNVAQTSPCEDVIPTEDQNADLHAINQEYPVDSISNDVVMPQATQAVPTGDLAPDCPEMPLEQLVPLGLVCQFPEVASFDHISALSLAQATHSSPDHPSCTTSPGIQRATPEESADDTAVPTVPVDHPPSPAPTSSADSDGVRGMNALCDPASPQSAMTEISHETPQDWYPVELALDPPANSDIPVAAASLASDDVPMELDKLAPEPPQASENSQLEALESALIAHDVADSPPVLVCGSADTEATELLENEDASGNSAPPLSADVVVENLQDHDDDDSGEGDVPALPTRLEDTEATEVLENINASEDFALSISADVVPEASASLQDHEDDDSREGDVPALSTRLEDTAVDTLAITVEASLPLQGAVDDATTLNDYAEADYRPLTEEDAGLVLTDERLGTPEECAESDEFAMPLAHDTPLSQNVPSVASVLSEQVGVWCSKSLTAPVPEDSQPGDTAMDVLAPGEADALPPAPTALSPIDAVALAPVQLDLVDESALDIDLADYYATLPDFEDAALGSDECDTAVSISEGTADNLALPDFGDAALGLDDCDTAVAVSEDATDNLALPEYDLPPSSPPPSSSPPRVFSSPGPASVETTPTSSPPLATSNKSAQLAGWAEEGASTDLQPLKRTLEEEQWVGSVDTNELSQAEEKQSKRMKMEDPAPVHTPPNPKRPTPASQAQQRRKLAAPFRSPIIKGPLVQGGLHALYATGRPIPPPPPRKARTEDDDKASTLGALLKPKVPVANKDRTANVAKQFKSPLQTGAASTSSSSDPAFVSGTFSSVRAAPTIQALQGKVQTLKQAIKIKNSGGGEDEDEVLEGLVEKWTTAAREVAWAVWDYVKDLDPGSAPDTGMKGGWFADDDERAGPGAKRGFDPNWGYDDGHVEKRARMDDGAEREDEHMRDEEEEEEPQVVQHTLGVMLRRLGIDPATLGWDEEEGDFVDVDA